MDKKLIDVEVPKQQLRMDRVTSLRQFKKGKKQLKIVASSSLSVAVLFVSLLVSSFFSPTIASYVSKIPGFEPLVKMVDYDKGMDDILDNVYFEEIGDIYKVNDLTISLVGVIADEMGMVISYEVNAPYDISELTVKNYEVKQNGETIEGSIATGWLDQDETYTIQDTITVTRQNKIFYENATFEVVLQFSDRQRSEVTMPFTLKSEVLPNKVYEINEKIEFDKQQLLLKSIEISPLRSKLTFVLDESNTMQILEIGSLKLVDETGEEWGRIMNGMVGSGSVRDTEFSIYMQSNYFREPKSLTLEIDEVRALPKGKDSFEIDLRTGTISKHEHLTLWNITLEDKLLTIDEDFQANSFREIIAHFIDANGDQYNILNTTYSSTESGMKMANYFAVDNGKNPLTAVISSYPNFIGGKQSIELPLRK